MLTLLSTLPATRPWMNTADTPHDRAAKLVKAMNLTEKLNLFHGSCGGYAEQGRLFTSTSSPPLKTRGRYVGNVCANERLGIPAIKMNDGPQGFRDNKHPGSSTAWPCSLAIAATFDPASSLAWGRGMGDEFFRKGSNVQLGPGICLARVPRNGRNFECIPIVALNPRDSQAGPMIGALAC
jgi:beta-glucosidase